jgi:protein involved in polysaccharide export with SLBB domain
MTGGMMMRRSLLILALLVCVLSFSYTVRVGDTIAIEVFQQPSFSRTVRVAFDGTIPYPYLGNAKVVGMTVDQIKEMIEQVVRRFIKEPEVTVYVQEYAPMYVYLQGALNRTIDISNYPDLTLTKLFSLLDLSLDSNVDYENVQLLRDGKTQKFNVLSFFFEGKIENDVALKEGDKIHLPPLKYEKTVQVGGAYSLIEKHVPGLTLRTLLLKLGTLDEEKAVIESAQLLIDGETKTIDLTKVLEGSFDVPLKPGAFLYIPKRPERYVYVVGFVPSAGLKTFTPRERQTLALALAKAGGISKDDEKWIEKILIKMPDGSVQELPSSVLSKAHEIEVPNRSIVEVVKHPEFYVYVQGAVSIKGKIDFEPNEKRTLKTLIGKVGLENPNVEWEGKAQINNETLVDLKDIVHAGKDVPLSLGDSILIRYEPFIVNVVGAQGGGALQLNHYEPKTLNYVLKKLSIQPESIEGIVLIREKTTSTYDASQLIKDQIEVSLERLDTVLVEQIGVNAVYLIGDVSSYIEFKPSEPITLHRILARVGLNDPSRIEKITLDGETLDHSKDLPIERGTILGVELKKPIRVTAMGYLKNTGRVEFGYRETPDLKTLFARLGGLIIGPELYYVSDKVFIMRDNSVVAQYDAQKVFMGVENAMLQDNDFVYVTVKEPNQVYVFGKGVPNGLVKFTQAEEFDLRTLVGKLGGIKEGISRKITIITDSGIDTFAWDEYANKALTNNSIILFDIDKENYVYLIKADGTPDMLYVDQNTTLYEVLMKARIDKNYRKIELTRGIEKYSLELKDIAQARSYVVKAGDVVKILDVPQNFAYVLGEVNKPGIVRLTEGTTVLQAIIQSGYFTNKAAASSVWLYKGGIDGKPIRVNLAGAIGGGRIEYDPILENGDIVFVPSDIFKSALEWIPVINNLIVFYNNISGLFK